MVITILHKEHYRKIQIVGVLQRQVGEVEDYFMFIFGNFLNPNLQSVLV